MGATSSPCPSTAASTSTAPAAVDHITTIVDALAAQLPGVEFLHVEGCGVTDDDRSGFAAAVDAAARSDVAVLVMGERSGLTDNCTTGESRDVASLDLPGVQEELVLAVAATGTPVVLVLVAGRPIGSEAVHRAASAVLVAWLPGEHGGSAVAEALAGVRSPGGKLPVTYPRSSGQIPTFYGHKASGGRSHWKVEYVDLSNEPMYPFGHGLTYSRFTVDVDATSFSWATVGDVVDVIATVTNVGPSPADEVVQLYTRDPIASITRPVLELQGFARVGLAPGRSARVTFHLPVASLGFSGPDMTYVVEPGEIELLVGTSSAALQPAGRVVVTGEEPIAATRVSATPVTIEYP